MNSGTPPRLLLPLLLIAGLLVAAGSPALNLRARDGKAQALDRGLLDLQQMQADAVAAGVADQQSSSNTAFLATPGATCTAGFAGPYPCENVDLLSIVPIPEIGAATGADVWGWTDLETGREIAIPTTTFGAAFVDVTDPTAPVVLGRAYIGAQDDRVIWRDVKVYDDHAYVVSEHPDTHLQIFDLNRFDDVTTDQGVIEPDAVYEGFGSAHNIAINVETGFAYVLAGDTCEGGMDMLDLSDPLAPVSVGCVNDETLGLDVPQCPSGVLAPVTGSTAPCPDFGLVHDAQCVIYKGSDTRYQGSEICFVANEGRGVFIVDVTDRENPQLLSHRTYDRVDYAHQGWLTADHKYWVFGDETDEIPAAGAGNIVTATFTYEVSDLEDPGEVMTFEHGTNAIDHNIYIEDGYVWQANYSAGLRVLDYTPESIAEGQYEQVAFFDVDPGEDGPVFAGSWTAYPFFESGTIVVNSFDSGLFLLKANLPEKTEETPPHQPGADQPQPAPDPEPGPAGDVADSSLPATGGGLALLGLVLLGVAVGVRRHGRAG